MKRAKDEEKTMGPMFPRLHVNDTEKGGPRAPPRNKMALYEQLSIPSQRSTHFALHFNPNITSASLVPHSSQSSGNERGMFSSHQLLPRLISEKQCCQDSDVSSPLTQIDQRKKLDEDDFTVPIFVHSMTIQEWGKNANMDREKVSPVGATYFSQSMKFSKSIGGGVIGHIPRQGGKIQKDETLKEIRSSQNEWDRTVSNSSIVEKTNGPHKQTNFSLSCELVDNASNRINSLRTDERVQCAESQTAGKSHSTTALEERLSALNKINSSARSFPLKDQNIVHDLANDTESPEDWSRRSLQIGNLDRNGSVPETSNMNAVSGLDVTPDDVVGMIGQEHFWKARRAITNQQRVFAFQIFELHRLVKVQKGIALSTHLLEDVASLGKTMKPTPPKDHPLDYTDKSDKVHPIACNQKSGLENSSQKNSFGKSSVPVIQTNVPPSINRPYSVNSNAQSVSSNHMSREWSFTRPQGQHQWLIPVMSPSEGLVYKPYPGHSFMGPMYGGYNLPGPNPFVGNFSSPAYGIPIPRPQYQLPPLPSPIPHGYFSSYGMPIMSTAFSSSSVEQTNHPDMPGQHSVGEANIGIQNPNALSQPSQNETSLPEVNALAYDGIEVQGSMTSSPSERLQEIGIVKARNVLPLFPTSPTSNSTMCSTHRPQPKHPSPRVIKVIPHHSKSATESAARIFQSIQEERKQHGSV